jgi:hypothetical protein
MTRDPLALDPLGSIGIGPFADDHSTPDPLALDPLSPVEPAARPIDASREHRETGKRKA